MEGSMRMLLIIIMQSGILKRYIKLMIFKCLSLLCQEFSVLGGRKKKIARKAKRFKPERKAANIFLKPFLSHRWAIPIIQAGIRESCPKREIPNQKTQAYFKKTKKSRKTGGKWIKNTFLKSESSLQNSMYSMDLLGLYKDFLCLHMKRKFLEGYIRNY